MLTKREYNQLVIVLNQLAKSQFNLHTRTSLQDTLNNRLISLNSVVEILKTYIEESSKELEEETETPGFHI
jgi:hypothetical protein